MGFVMLALLCSLLVAVSAFVVIFLIVKSNKWATTVEENSILFVQQGGSGEEQGDLHKLLLNSSSYKLCVPRTGNEGDDKSEYEIVPTKEETPVDKVRVLETWLQSQGFWWVSWLWPYRSIMKIGISKDRLRADSEIANRPEGEIPLGEKIKHESGEIKNLRVEIQRYILVQGVELKEGNTVDLILVGDFYVRYPYRTVFKTKGDFFLVLQALCANQAYGVLAGLAYDEFLALPKGKGTHIADELQKVSSNLEEIVGLKCLSLHIKEHAPSGATFEFLSAVKAQRRAELEAKGVIATADGEARAIRTRAAAEASRYQLIRETLMAQGANADRANDALAQIFTAEQVARLNNLQVLGSGAFATLGINKPQKGEQ